MTLVQQATRYVFAGAGLSAGRSLWQGFKGNWQWALIVIAIIGSFYLPYDGAKNIIKGHHNRGFFKTIFVTIFGSLFMIILGAGLLALELSIIASWLASAWPTPDDEFGPPLSYFGYILTIICALGFIIGFSQRSKRKKAFSVTDANDLFLRENGIIETGGKDITHYDSNNTPLRLLEFHADRVLFMVVGARGKRAVIDLDKFGQFIKYTPA